MFCQNCGKQISEESKFCPGCGSAVFPPASQPVYTAPQPVMQTALAQQKPKKTVNKVLLSVIAAVLVVAIGVSIVLANLDTGMETVYVLTSVTHVSPIDSTPYSYNVAYDEFGNPDIYATLYFRLYEIAYDECGNMTEMYDLGNIYNVYLDSPFHDLKFEVDYDYDGNGRIKSAEYHSEYLDTPQKWSFTWDRDGNLVRVCLDNDEKGAWDTYHRLDCDYDSEDRLIREYYFDQTGVDQCTVTRVDYIYNSDGKVESVKQGTVVETKDYRDIETEDLTFKMERYLELEYNQQGKITGGKSWEQGERITWEREYDLRGNLIFKSDEVTYDWHGNLTFLGTSSDAGFKFTYEPVKMTHEAAERYRHSARMYGCDEIANYLYPSYPYPVMFFYYLIPNPIW